MRAFGYNVAAIPLAAADQPFLLDQPTPSASILTTSTISSPRGWQPRISC
jgi:hypothetical protein